MRNGRFYSTERCLFACGLLDRISSQKRVVLTLPVCCLEYSSLSLPLFAAAACRSPYFGSQASKVSKAKPFDPLSRSLDLAVALIRTQSDTHTHTHTVGLLSHTRCLRLPLCLEFPALDLQTSDSTISLACQLVTPVGQVPLLLLLIILLSRSLLTTSFPGKQLPILSTSSVDARKIVRPSNRSKCSHSSATSS